ncbi:MAG: metallophosphoesterase [Caulobacterales bacterium]
MSTFRLAHISDLHLAPPAPVLARRRMPLKAHLSRFAWRRKGAGHSMEALGALIADLQTQNPDHVAITGDLTNFSTSEEFAAAGEWLRGWADPQDVTVSPGNHDALAGGAGPERFQPWAPWLGDEGTVQFPSVRRRGAVALINLSSATPTPLHLAQGHLGEQQLERLGGVLKKTGDEGLCRVVLLHHPPAPGTVSRRKSLKDGPALLSVLHEYGAELVLHGHAHQACVASLAGPNGSIPVLGVPSASAVGGHDAPARWHCISIENTAKGWKLQVTARGLNGGGAMIELGRYSLV